MVCQLPIKKIWKYLATGFSNITQAIILFSLAAIFVPEAVNLSLLFTKAKAIGYLFCGVALFIIGGIISKKGYKNE